ncbi:hypothetical protein FB645_000233 [Coemansia sp. IMI 203386]|nr:hypothetical protein FB645_000233 [Coemansia sp. IMI 203386]
MKFFGYVVGLALLSAQAAAITPPAGAQSLTACSDVIVRKEVRSLSTSEWNAYKSAANAAFNDRWLDWFGFLHDRIALTIHGNSMFLVYHRALTRDYEKILRSYDSSVAVPYWNAMVDYQHPDQSPVFSADNLGGNGGSDGCVTGGLAKDWKYVYPDAHCLRRKYSSGSTMPAWHSPEFLTHVMQSSTTYAALRAGVENSIHGAVHLALGGDMDTMYSPVDPIFWVHHANIDRLYAQWQAVSPEDRTYMIDGVAPDNSPADVNMLLTGTTKPACTVMRLGYGDMCYTYDTIQAANGDATALSKRNTQKCIPRPNQATEAIKKLPAEVLQQFYPSFSNGTVNPLENEMTTLTPHTPIGSNGTYTATKPNEAMRGKMPVPMKLTDEWIKMQHACVEEVRDLETRANNMIDALNKANYLSPYLS